MNKFNLAGITSKLVGLEYELGKMDCFMLAVEYLKIRGHEFPESYRGLTLVNYKDLWLRDSKKAKIIMIDFLDRLLQPVHNNKRQPGDLLLTKLKGYPAALSIDGGNANIVCATEEKGVTVVPLRYYMIERSWSCRKQSQ